MDSEKTSEEDIMSFGSPIMDRFWQAILLLVILLLVVFCIFDCVKEIHKKKEAYDNEVKYLYLFNKAGKLKKTLRVKGSIRGDSKFGYRATLENGGKIEFNCDYVFSREPISFQVRDE